MNIELYGRRALNAFQELCVHEHDVMCDLKLPDEQMMDEQTPVRIQTDVQ